MSRLYVVPLELAEANQFVRILHRHHDPLPAHRFSLGAIDGDGVVRGAAICSRPAARALSSRDVLEVARLVTDGTPNACSVLYGAAARAAKDQGYLRVQTYILSGEQGTSLRAAGWRFDGLTEPSLETSHNWKNRPGRTQPEHLYERKGRWVKDFGARPSLVAFTPAVEASLAATLDFSDGAA